MLQETNRRVTYGVRPKIQNRLNLKINGMRMLHKKFQNRRLGVVKRLLQSENKSNQHGAKKPLLRLPNRKFGVQVKPRLQKQRPGVAQIVKKTQP